MYLTVTEALSNFSSLNAEYEGGRVSESQIEGWIDEACSLIDGYIGSRYQLPFSETPPLISMLAIEFFEYFYQKSKYTPTSTGDEVPWLYARYDRLMKLLKQIADGKLMLFDSEGEEVGTAARKLGVIDSNHIDNDPIFTMDDAEEQEIPDDYGETMGDY